MSIRLLGCIQYLIQGPAHGRHSIECLQAVGQMNEYFETGQKWMATV